MLPLGLTPPRDPAIRVVDDIITHLRYLNRLCELVELYWGLEPEYSDVIREAFLGDVLKFGMDDDVPDVVVGWLAFPIPTVVHSHANRKEAGYPPLGVDTVSGGDSVGRVYERGA